jgi:hypothetical protein
MALLIRDGQHNEDAVVRAVRVGKRPSEAPRVPTLPVKCVCRKNALNANTALFGRFVRVNNRQSIAF